MAKQDTHAAPSQTAEQFAFDFGTPTRASELEEAPARKSRKKSATALAATVEDADARGAPARVTLVEVADTSAKPAIAAAAANQIEHSNEAMAQNTHSDETTATAVVVEVLEPSSARTDGQQEREFFARMSEKAERYEDRMSRHLFVFFALVLATVFTKAGVPVLQSVFSKFEIQPLDTTQICGVLGAGAVVFFLLACYCALRVKQFTPHQPTFFPAHSWAGRAAQFMFNGGVALLLLVLALEVVMTFWDIIHTVIYLFDHIIYRLDGWEPVAHHKKS